MERYGTDKPDLRFGMELVDVSEVFAATEFKAFQAEAVKAHPRARRGRRDPLEARRLIERAKQLGAGGLVWMRVGDGRALDAPILKFLSEAGAARPRRRARRAARAICCCSSRASAAW